MKKYHSIMDFIETNVDIISFFGLLLWVLPILSIFTFAGVLTTFFKDMCPLRLLNVEDLNWKVG